MKTIASSENLNPDANIIKEHALLQEKLWIDSTLTRFDDVLRENYDKSLEEFSDAIIGHLATTTNAVKGAFFVVKKGEKNSISFVEATGGFACAIETMPKKILGLEKT